jgi:hypothetical protein
MPATETATDTKENSAFSLKVTSAHKSSGGGFKFSQAKNGGGSAGNNRRSGGGGGKGKGGGGKGGKGSWLKKAADSVVTEYKTQQNKITSWIEDAKKKTAGILAAGIGTDQNIGLAHEKAHVDAVRNSGNKTGATTGRAKADTLAGKLTKTTKNNAIK